MAVQTLFTFYKTNYLNEEVNHTYPSPSVNVPWPVALNPFYGFNGSFTQRQKSRQASAFWRTEKKYFPFLKQSHLARFLPSINMPLMGMFQLVIAWLSLEASG